jgi:hypothetical protein
VTPLPPKTGEQVKAHVMDAFRWRTSTRELRDTFGACCVLTPDEQETIRWEILYGGLGTAKEALALLGGKT